MSTTIQQIGQGGGPIAAGNQQLGLNYTFWVPNDATAITAEGYWGPSQGIFIQNFSPDQSLTVVLDSRYTFVVPQGNRELFNLPFTIAVAKYAAATSSPAALTLFSDTQDNQNALRSITVLGNINATVSGSVNISGTSGNLPVSLVAQSITLTAQDIIVENNTTALQGLLPGTIIPMVFSGGWSEQNVVTLPTGRTQISIMVPLVTSAHNGAMIWLYYIVSGRRIYLENKTYYTFIGPGELGTWLGTWLTYDESIPSGATIGIGCDGIMTILVKI